MAKTPRPRPGGKLALFEVLQSASDGGDDSAGGGGGGGGGGAAVASSGHASVSPATMSAAVSRSRSSSRSEGGLFQAGADGGGGRVGRTTSSAGLLLATLSIGAAVAFGFVAGRFTGPASALAGAPMPEVMDVSDNLVVTRTPGPANGAAPAPRAKPAANESAKTSAALPSGPVTRVAGTNYVLIQSYAKTERDRAEATVAALAKAGIGATIESDIPGWRTRLCIFGTENFERVRSNPEYNDYIARLQAVSNAASGDKLVKKFEPMPVQWGR